MKNLSILFAFAVLIACKSDKPKAQNSENDTSINKVVETAKDDLTPSKYIPVITWVDDFKNFRQAIYIKDKAKLKTYFNFPVVATEDSSLWYLVQLNDSEWQKRKAKYGSKADSFFEEDFDKYFDAIFDADFTITIMKVKMDKLLSDQHAESPQFTSNDYTYQMLVDFYVEEQNALYLNMSFGNTAVDENGEKVSEGEHNNIYIFQVIDGKKIIFKKFTVAG
ncbi:hypothetical protein [Pedobacter agri]|uniref:hypothetical protein n=1 Tax=Pedobacter agri TaxID=454586 RepID=UPI002931A877|nr:hypothetical protein [Pedobacter agri]